MSRTPSRAGGGGGGSPPRTRAAVPLVRRVPARPGRRRRPPPARPSGPPPRPGPAGAGRRPVAAQRKSSTPMPHQASGRCCGPGPARDASSHMPATATTVPLQPLRRVAVKICTAPSTTSTWLELRGRALLLGRGQIGEEADQCAALGLGRVAPPRRRSRRGGPAGPGPYCARQPRRRRSFVEADRLPEPTSATRSGRRWSSRSRSAQLVAELDAAKRRWPSGQ